MNDEAVNRAATFVEQGFVSQGRQALARAGKRTAAILSNKRLPEQGWSEPAIDYLLNELAMMDSNNFIGASGVGEREGRIASAIVARHNLHLAHGIGRSGDIAANQPKAAGSSLMSRITRFLAIDALQEAGLKGTSDCAVVPLATGMTMTMALLTIAKESAQYVLWSRVDQKTCVKSITCCNFEVIPLDPVQYGDELQTDCQRIESEISRLGDSQIAAIVTTTSCFAPRAMDNVEQVARICHRAGIPHMVNNAYGVQSHAICKEIANAWRRGRVDCVVQSTDKNFLVPVGGSIVASGPGSNVPSKLAAKYPGRASIAPVRDLFVTFLHIGKRGIRDLLAGREDLSVRMAAKFSEFATNHGERLLTTPNNPISMAMTLDRLEEDVGRQRITQLGSMLFARGITGARVIARGDVKKVAGYEFHSYGASITGYEHSYITAAAAVGGSEEEFDDFLKCAPRRLAGK